MRVFAAVTLAVLALAGCKHRIENIAGVYEMVRYEGKPLPFGGVRSGQMNLRTDGTLLAHIRRAAVVGRPAATSDTVPGAFGLQTWGGACIGIWMEFPGFVEDPRVFGEVCGDTLFTYHNGGIFRKTKTDTLSRSGPFS